MNINMDIKDKFPDNVRYSIQQYAAEPHSQDMLDEIQHSYADKMLKQFHTQIIHKCLIQNSMHRADMMVLMNIFFIWLTHLY